LKKEIASIAVVIMLLSTAVVNFQFPMRESFAEDGDDYVNPDLIEYVPEPAPSCSDGLPLVTTDKEDYSPGDTVNISGCNFLPDVGIVFTITEPDGSVIPIVGIISDNTGSFTTTYGVNSLMPVGEYTINASDGTNNVVATFTDGTVAFSNFSVSPTGGVRLGEVMTWSVEAKCAGSACGSIPIGGYLTGIKISLFQRNTACDGTTGGFSHRQTIIDNFITGLVTITQGANSVTAFFSDAQEPPNGLTGRFELRLYATLGGAGAAGFTTGGGPVTIAQGANSVTTTFTDTAPPGLDTPFEFSNAFVFAGGAGGPGFRSGPDLDPSNGIVSGKIIAEGVGPKCFRVQTLGTQSVGGSTVPAATIATGSYISNPTIGITVSGVKFEDNDFNGVKDGTDTLRDGWTIRLYKDPCATPNALFLTDSTDIGTGAYAFPITTMSEACSDIYTICEVQQATYTEDLPTGNAFCTAAGEATAGYRFNLSFAGLSTTDLNNLVLNRDFGNYRSATIAGDKWKDVDGDSIIGEGGEVKLDGFEIVLTGTDGMGNAVNLSMETGDGAEPLGHYKFTVPPGTYRVCEDLAASSANPGFVQSYPTSATAGCPASSPNGYSGITVTSGQSITGKDFGNFDLQGVLVTGSNLRVSPPFDRIAGGPDREFGIIITPDQKVSVSKISSTNPGQFYENVIVFGLVNIVNHVPYPFVTQGANAIQVHDGVTIVGGVLVPGPDVTSTCTNISQTSITLSDYAAQAFGQEVLVTIQCPATSSGLAYITKHLDYGLKGQTGFALVSKASNNAGCAALPPSPPSNWCTHSIPEHQSYLFDVPTIGSETIYSTNLFKKDPGFGGLVTQSGTPVQNVKVQIFGPSGILLKTVYTDQDGWYSYPYKHTAKSATYTITLPEHNQSKTVIVKSNGLALVDFQI